MSHKKDRASAAAGHPHGVGLSSGPGQPAQLFHCPFPGCGATFVKIPGKPDACARHRQFIVDVVFCLQRVSVTQSPGVQKPLREIIEERASAS